MLLNKYDDSVSNFTKPNLFQICKVQFFGSEWEPKEALSLDCLHLGGLVCEEKSRIFFFSANEVHFVER